jgi:hypothetical protein
MSDKMKNLRWAALSAALYFVVANPMTYDVVQSLLGGVVTVKTPGGPTQAGTAVHALVFGLVTFLIKSMMARRSAAAMVQYY